MRTRTVASIIISTTLRIAAGCRIDTSSFHCVTHQDLRGIARQIRKTTITACNVVILQIPTVTVAYIIRISYLMLLAVFLLKTILHDNQWNERLSFWQPFNNKRNFVWVANVNVDRMYSLPIPYKNMQNIITTTTKTYLYKKTRGSLTNRAFIYEHFTYSYIYIKGEP